MSVDVVCEICYMMETSLGDQKIQVDTLRVSFMERNIILQHTIFKNTVMVPLFRMKFYCQSSRSVAVLAEPLSGLAVEILAKRGVLFTTPLRNLTEGLKPSAILPDAESYS